VLTKVHDIETNAHTSTNTHTHTHTHTHIHTHTYIQIYTHTHMYAHAHTHTLTRTWSCTQHPTRTQAAKRLAEAKEEPEVKDIIAFLEERLVRTHHDLNMNAPMVLASMRILLVVRTILSCCWPHVSCIENTYHTTELEGIV
jgi:metabotropic glutamate receptor 6/7/8